MLDAAACSASAIWRAAASSSSRVSSSADSSGAEPVMLKYTGSGAREGGLRTEWGGGEGGNTERAGSYPV